MIDYLILKPSRVNDTLCVCVYSCCKYNIYTFYRVAQGQPEVPPSVVGHPPQLPLRRTPLPHR